MASTIQIQGDMLERLLLRFDQLDQPTLQHLGQTHQHEVMSRVHPQNGGEISVRYSHTPLPRSSQYLFNKPINLDLKQLDGDMESLLERYMQRSKDFINNVILKAYCNIIGKRTNKIRNFKENKLLQQKMQVPMFDGSDKIFARAWLQKLMTYFEIFPTEEQDVARFATIYLQGKTYEWWYNDLTT